MCVEQSWVHMYKNFFLFWIISRWYDESVFKNDSLHHFCIFINIQAEKDAEKDKKRPGSRGSAKSKSSKEREAEPQEPPSEENLAPPERFWPVCRY